MLRKKCRINEEAKDKIRRHIYPNLDRPSKVKSLIKHELN